MSHELAKGKDGKAAMAYVGEVPWHGLGHKATGKETREEFCRLAGTDFKVAMKPMYVTDDLGVQHVVKGHASIYREDTGTVLDVVSNRYKPIQNEIFFRTVDEFLNDKSVKLETAGVLRGGRHVWLLCRLNESFEVAGGRDRSDAYLLCSNAFMAGFASSVLLTPIRVVCNNTITAALIDEKGKRASYYHWDDFDTEHAKAIVGIGKAGFAAYAEQAKFLSGKRYKDKDYVAYIKRVYDLREPTLNMEPERRREQIEHNKVVVDRMNNLLINQPGVELAPGTWWHAFNAVTFDTDHGKGSGRDARLASAWYGVGALRKQRALTLAIDYAQAA